jgi:ferritin-like protein
MSTKELQERIVANMKSWQKIENASAVSTGKIMEKTDHPIIRLVMEIIQRDSMLHHRVQEMVVETLERKAVALTPEQLAEVWGLIEEHIELEKKTIQHATEALDALKGKKMVVQEYLIHYLLQDETKHNKLLDSLAMIKKGMYPYG